MFDIGLQEMLVIGVLALLVFGPSKLPELGRMVGRAMREFRRASDEFRSTVETNLHINDTEPYVPPTTEGEISPVDASSTVAQDALPSETEPVTDREASVPAGDPPPEPYCSRRGSRLLHRHDCTWVARIAHADRVYWKRMADAAAEGLMTCPACEPWEPA
jgi:TatA/E family protein of Tat protein translocase